MFFVIITLFSTLYTITNTLPIYFFRIRKEGEKGIFKVLKGKHINQFNFFVFYCHRIKILKLTYYKYNIYGFIIR